MNDYDKAGRYLVKGWNMKTSPFLNEIRAEGREEGREEGRVEQARVLLLRQGRRKFGVSPTKKQHKALMMITDIARLEALADRLLDVDSWAELLRPPRSQANAKTAS
jgi:predicted transposase YdaD